ncbi:hypothetical protein SAMN05216420_10723 [Nitrosospira sp. Nl5]|nr:hypothetical protein SAMN05216420_10723 [Nitrosospira sp. Nl5]
MNLLRRRSVKKGGDSPFLLPPGLTILAAADLPLAAYELTLPFPLRLFKYVRQVDVLELPPLKKWLKIVSY